MYQRQGSVNKPIQENDGVLLDCCIFLLMWGHENNQDPICDRIRTRFVITFPNCHILWVTKIQTYISLYTLHYEYMKLFNSI